MIFVTVGSQTPFDRLIEAMDQWARANGAVEVFAQIGSGAYAPQHMRWVRSLPPAEFRQRCATAQAIVAHAGMGSVLTALEFCKPLLLLPRRASLRETRNDHQVATARWLSSRPGIVVADDEHALPVLMPQLLTADDSLQVLQPQAPAGFVDALRAFIQAG